MKKCLAPRNCFLFCGAVLLSASALLLLKPFFSVSNYSYRRVEADHEFRRPKAIESETAADITSTVAPFLPTQSQLSVSKWSNPLWKEECANAVLVKDGIDIEEAIRSHVPAIVTKWYNKQKNKKNANLNQTIDASIARVIHETRHNHLIWGRERLDALLSGANFAEYFDLPTNALNTRFNATTAKWESSKSETSGRLTFFRNFKAMSSSITAMMTQGKVVTVPRSRRIMFQTQMSDFFGDDSKAEIQINKRNGFGFDYDCGFTFVRHPIDKFISGYGEVESNRIGVKKKLQFSKVDVNRFNDLDNASEDLLKRIELRFVTFVNELLEGGGDFIRKERVLNHVASATGHRMSLYAAWRQDFVGKVEHFASDWQYLTHSMPKCAAGFNQAAIDSGEVRHDRQRDEWKPAKDIWRRVLENNRTMFEALVDFYVQDFVCYDYSTSHSDWINSRHKVLSDA